MFLCVTNGEPQGLLSPAAGPQYMGQLLYTHSLMVGDFIVAFQYLRSICEKDEAGPSVLGEGVMVLN